MVTVNRVLPWRRNAAPAAVELAPMIESYRRHHPRATTSLITDAYELAAEAHEGQYRKSGERYITHPLAVAAIVAELGLDDTTIAAALLHDAVEDTRIDLTTLDGSFGSTVSGLVDGVTKLDRMAFDSKEAQQAATVRKMVVAMAADLRVIIVKLADRLHNMRTIAGLSEAKQSRIAHETVEIYAPLAHRLGMQEMRQQLEDLAFATLHPRGYAEIDHLVSVRSPERELYLVQVQDQVSERLRELRIDAEVTGRPKALWSIYEKMVQRGRAFDDIYDLVGIRVLVESVQDCYAALGSLHGAWKPVQGRFKDYIAQPKFNLYQSLHTTVIGPGGKGLEVQIRTREMHARAEHGVAAHWAYKDGNGGLSRDDMVWLNRIVDWQSEITDPAQFFEALKVDLEQDEVYVFTPKGDVVPLARGATPIDFAYAIHTEVGHACIGARVNDRLVSLDSRLASGDRCEVVTSRAEGVGPKQDWLNTVGTTRAASKIRQWFSRERREDARDQGREELTDAIRREGLPVQQLPAGALDSVASELNYVDLDALRTAIGEHHVSAKSVADRLARKLRGGDPAVQSQLSTSMRRRRRPPRGGDDVGVSVEGLDDMMVSRAGCCSPVPDDQIVGYVTRGRGVTVHRADCAEATGLMANDPDRHIEVEWNASGDALFTSSIAVEGYDRPRLLSDVCAAIADQGVNIASSETTSGDDRLSRMLFLVELSEAAHLSAVLSAIRSVDGVYQAFRIVPGGDRDAKVAEA